MKRYISCIVMCALLLLPATSVLAYDVDVAASVPDVDKNPFPPGPGDLSCWQASAANLLGAGGWGNADTIYGQMTTHFGTALPGKVELAMNWWLYNYGYNPDAGTWYQPSNMYNDATIVNKSLDHADYDYLLGELSNSKYVSVSWDFYDPASETSFQHAITLVGGNYSTSGTAKSLWHDSDRDVGGTNDDAYNNYFGGTPGPGAGNWQIDYTPAWNANNANKFVTLAPGVQKPDSAMSNYDAAYFRDIDPQTGNEIKSWRTAGVNNYGDPTWDPDAVGDYAKLMVPNVADPEWQKQVYLLIDYKNGYYDELSAPNIDLEVEDPDNPGTFLTLDPTTLQFSLSGGQILFIWELDFQPAWENILFPSTDYYYLTGDVKDFNIATECIPEPMTLSLLAIGGMALLRRRK